MIYKVNTVPHYLILHLVATAVTERTVSYTMLSRRWSSATGVELSAWTVGRGLLRAGLVARLPLRLLPLSRNNQCIRLHLPRGCRHWHPEWQNVMFADEFRFNLPYHDGMMTVYVLDATLVKTIWELTLLSVIVDKHLVWWFGTPLDTICDLAYYVFRAIEKKSPY